MDCRRKEALEGDKKDQPRDASSLKIFQGTATTTVASTLAPQTAADYSLDSDLSSLSQMRGNRKKNNGRIRMISLDHDSLAQVRSRRDIKDNSVRTKKYTWWSFLPLNLWE